MVLRVDDQAFRTDTGRQRSENEDSLFVRAPIFVVADGMGGAQAGEVASKTAAEAFDRDLPDAPPGVVLRETIEAANREIHQLAHADPSRAGMGTTITAAIVDAQSEEVGIGHVGDSRAYRLRAGKLERLTRDHSLVEEMRRKGQITDEQAEEHPQRSIITRALGPEPDVEVDVQTVPASPGDVFLLCSDGLTTMVDDVEIRDLVTRANDLDQAGKGLVKAANKAGGEDNVTVVLFRLAEGEGALEDTMVASGNGRGQDDDLEDTLTGLEAPTIAAPAATAVAEREWGPALDEEPAPRPAPVETRGWGRRAVLGALALAFVAAILAVAFWALTRANFIGVEEDGNVAVYQGVPWDLGGGVHLYRAKYVSQLQAVQLTPSERATLLDHALSSYDSARDRLASYEQEASP